MKKGEKGIFDVPMGSHYGVEVCELVGIYLTGKLSSIIDKKNVGLCKDDGFSVIENTNGPKLDDLRKDAIAIFHNVELEITIDYRHKFNHHRLLRCYLRSIYWKIPPL